MQPHEWTSPHDPGYVVSLPAPVPGPWSGKAAHCGTSTIFNLEELWPNLEVEAKQALTQALFQRIGTLAYSDADAARAARGEL